jgi:hypothetical protein
MPPGAIGAAQLQRGGPLRGFFQPVEVRGPRGSRIALAADGTFTESMPQPVRVGMLIAPVYRLRVTNIPLRPGLELFPTIEIIDRLYAPRDQAHRFPIPIELTEQDLTLASEGKFVTRVIYVEDPQSALPVDDDPHEQGWFDAGAGADPLEVADLLGRPVAILRIGGRLPDDTQGISPSFLHGSPPWQLIGKPVCLPEQPGNAPRAMSAPENAEPPGLPRLPSEPKPIPSTRPSDPNRIPRIHPADSARGGTR